MPSTCCVEEAEREVSLLSDGVLGVTVHVNVRMLNVILRAFEKL